LLAICAALATVTWAAQDTSAVPTDPTLVKPLRSGTQVPTFTVRRTDGTAYVFEASKRKVPAVVLFYRGGWCPFCNVHLGQLKAAEATLRKRGYEIMFLSSDRADILRTSLKDDIEKETAHYTLLSDADASAARAFGVAFRLDDKTYEQYKSFGIDLEQTAGNKQHILPVPAVFVVDKRGTVRFAHFNPDYKIRLSADELLKAAPANLR
jgi:peroxiredoxin